MGEVAALSAAACWALASLIFTSLSRDHGPIVMNALKCVLALAMLTATLLLLDGPVWPADASSFDVGVLALSGVVGLTIGDTAYFNALTRLGARRALLFMALAPATTALLAWPILGETPTTTIFAGIVVTTVGVGWVINERTEDDNGQLPWAGLAFALLAMFCQSTGNVLTKLGGTHASALWISVVRVLVGSIGLLVVLTAAGRLRELVEPFKEPSARHRLLFATFLGTYLGIWLLNAGLKYTSHTGIAATLSSTSPIFILPLAWFVAGERFSARSAVGALLAVVGIALLFVA